MENTKSNSRIDAAIRECNSKYCIMILQAVLGQPGIRLKNLADTLHIPSSNLQRVLKRMMSVDPALIYSNILEGKTKGFWISKEAEEYFGKAAGPEADPKTEETVTGIFARWIQLEGTLKWKQRLQEVVKNDQDILAEEKIEFEKLIKVLPEVKDKDGIRAFLGDKLFSLIMEYTAEHNRDIANCLYILTDLCSRSWESAMRLVDYFFDVNIHHKNRDSYRRYSTYEVEQAQFDSILWALDQLVLFVGKEAEIADKDTLFQLISEKAELNNFIGFYIADKILNSWEKIEKRTDGDN